MARVVNKKGPKRLKKRVRRNRMTKKKGEILQIKK